MRPPSIDQIADRLQSLCRRHGIVRLDIFGSVARGEGKVGSDVDLIGKFASPPGSGVVRIAEEMERILGVPVHFVTEEDVIQSENVFRQELIERDRQTIYVAGT